MMEKEVASETLEGYTHNSDTADHIIAFSSNSHTLYELIFPVYYV
jgi:hypothetical protein